MDIFKYKAKTGYRRRQGHRQKFTTIEVTDIVLPGAPKKAEKPTKADAKVAAEASDSGADKLSEDTNLEKAPVAKAPAAKKSPTALKKQASAEADPKEA